VHVLLLLLLLLLLLQWSKMLRQGFEPWTY
jgi:hypothetical protein